MSTAKEPIPAYDKYPILHLYLMRLQIFGTIGDKDDLSAFLLELDCCLSFQPSPGLREHAIAFGKWTNNSWYTPHYAKWIHLREGLAGMKTTEELYGLFVKCPEGMPALSMDVESTGVKEVCGCGRTLIPVLDKSGKRMGVTHETTEDEEHHSGYFRSLTVAPGSTPSVQPIEGEQKATDPWFILKYVKTVLGRGFPREEIIDLIGKKLNEHSCATQSAPEAQPIADHIHVQLESGAVATVSSDASTELLGALNTMVEKAMQMPIADKEVPEDGEPPKELKDYLEAKMRPYHNRISFIAGALECYHKMQEEIKDADETCRDVLKGNYITNYNKLRKELATTRTEISTQAIQIAGLLASNKEWGEKYAEACRQLQEAKILIEGFVRIWRAEGNKGCAPKNITNALKFLAQFPQPLQSEK